MPLSKEDVQKVLNTAEGLHPQDPEIMYVSREDYAIIDAQRLIGEQVLTELFGATLTPVQSALLASANALFAECFLFSIQDRSSLLFSLAPRIIADLELATEMAGCLYDKWFLLPYGEAKNLWAREDVSAIQEAFQNELASSRERLDRDGFILLPSGICQGIRDLSTSVITFALGDEGGLQYKTAFNKSLEHLRELTGRKSR